MFVLSAEKGTKFVEDGVRELLKARRVLCGSYVYGYYLEDNGYNKTIFEFMQVILHVSNNSRCRSSGKTWLSHTTLLFVSNKMLRYTVYLFLEIALHVSGGISTNHQEHIQLYLQHLALVKPLLLPATIVR